MASSLATKANEVVVLDYSFPNSADLSTKQYNFVKMVSDGTVDVCSGVTDVAFGVLQNAPSANQVAQVRLYGISMVKTGMALSAGTPVSPAGSATAVSAIATSYVAGVMTCGTANSGEIGSILVTNSGTL
jgi:hypothetical protein